MELAAGTTVDKFVVTDLLGRGGMASVYKIRHRDLNVFSALKVMHVTHPELAGRIKSEGMLQAELRHPNIVTVFDIVDVAGAPGLVMEYVDGPSLAGLLETYRPTLDQIDDIARGILRGVRAAHKQGMIHRDLKPANVMLATGDDGYVPKITDFGLAKSLQSSSVSNQTRTGAVMGTPAYMAPEQFRNTRGVDARADVYSLGVMLYELCAGQRPYDAEDLFDMLDRIRRADYPRVAELVPSLPDRMADAIDGAMVVSVDERIPDVDTLYQVWSGRVKLDRSRVWDRSSMQRISDSLGQVGDGPPSSPSIAPQPPVVAAPAPPPTDDVSLEQLPRLLARAEVAEPAPAPAEPPSAPAPLVVHPAWTTPPDDEDEPVADETRFEARPASLPAVEDEPPPRPVEEPPAPAAVAPAVEPVAADPVPPSPPAVTSLVPREAPAVVAPPLVKVDRTPSGATAPPATDATAASGVGAAPILGGVVAALGLGGVAALGVAAVAAVGLGWWMWPGDTLGETLPPIVAPEEPAPKEVEAPPPVPKVDPEPQVRTDPRPRPKPAQTPSVGRGKVTLTGDARIRLVASDGRTYGTGTVPAGTYTLFASWPGQAEEEQTSKVIVPAGGVAAITCKSGFYSCTVKSTP